MSAIVHEVDLTKETPSNIEVGYMLNAPYSGKSISMTLPKGRYILECWGAQGGYRNNENFGGKGGYSRGTITLSEPTRFYIYAGGSGNSVSTSDGVHPGGFNGGGKRAYNPGGGGASDIRIGSDSLYARVIVAGGGGSDGGTNNYGGYGGGNTGETKSGSGSNFSGYGTGGFGGTANGNSSGSGNWLASSQSASAAYQQDCYSGFGFGGNGVYANTGYGGAGGGGWYGGTGTVPDSSGDDDKGGGGGSGYIYISDTAGIYPSGCLLDSSMYLDEATTIAGNKPFESPSGVQETGHSGDGYVRISVLDIESQPPQPSISTRFYLKISGSWRVVA